MDKPPRSDKSPSRKRPSAKPDATPDKSPSVDPTPGAAPVRSTPRRRSPALAEPPERRLTATTSRVTEPDFYSPAELRSLREALGVSQSVFAGLVGVSKSLVEHWEGGIRVPSAMARRLLDTIAADPRRFLRELTAPRLRRQGGEA